MIKVAVFIFLFVSVLSSKSLTVAVAANASYVMGDIKKEFKKLYPNTDVKVILGGSGKLTAQIKYGAPYHIFLSADMKFPQTLYKEKLALTKPVVYAEGALAILSRSKLDITKGIELVLDDKVKKIAIANPKIAPYGKASFEALKNKKLLERVKKKFIYADSISQTLSYATRVTDIGFVAKSALYSKKMAKYKENKHWISVDSSLYTPIKQGIVLLKRAKNNAEAKLFYEFILSEKAKEIFSRFGYRAI